MGWFDLLLLFLKNTKYLLEMLLLWDNVISFLIFIFALAQFAVVQNWQEPRWPNVVTKSCDPPGPGFETYLWQ